MFTAASSVGESKGEKVCDQVRGKRGELLRLACLGSAKPSAPRRREGARSLMLQTCLFDSLALCASGG